jgi:hypothetical protein
LPSSGLQGDPTERRQEIIVKQSCFYYFRAADIPERFYLENMTEKNPWI